MLKKPIKGIFFDIGHTLFHPSTGHWMFPKISENLLDINGIYKMSIVEFSECYKKCIYELNNNRFVSNVNEECEQFRKFYNTLSENVPELNLTNEKIDLIVQDRLNNPDNYIFYEDVHDTLAILKDNYKLGIISDTWPSTESLLKKEGLYDLFDSLTFSCYLGVSKPHPKMYEHALSNINLPAEQTIFIDDLKENLIGAKKLGIQPVLINKKSHKKDKDFPTIFNVAEIINYL